MRNLTTRKNTLFDDMFDNFFTPAFGYSGTNLMKADIRAKDGNYFLDIEVPGYKKEDLKISLFNGNLTISAEHSETQEEKDAKGNIIRQERYSGSASRTFYVGDAITDKDIKASYVDGILTLEFPSEKKKKKMII